MSDAHPDVLDLMDEFLGQVQTEKAAAAKAAATGNDPGGHQNQGTSHPVTSSDDGTVAATEGERSSENEADVKADYDSTLNYYLFNSTNLTTFQTDFDAMRMSRGFRQNIFDDPLG